MRATVLAIAALFGAAAVAQPVVTQFEAARSAPLTDGQWSYSTSAAGSEARFGFRFQIRCDRATRRILLRRIEPVAAIPASPVSIATDTMSRTLPADGWLGASDPLLAAIAFSRGRFVVDGGGGRLALPASPEAARSIEDCRI